MYEYGAVPTAGVHEDVVYKQYPRCHGHVNVWDLTSPVAAARQNCHHLGKKEKHPRRLHRRRRHVTIDDDDTTAAAALLLFFFFRRHVIHDRRCYVCPFICSVALIVIIQYTCISNTIHM